ANTAASASDRPSATGRARESQARPAKRAVSPAGSQRTGSESAVRLSATPPMPMTGSQRKNRRSSTSRASAPAKAFRQSGAGAAARESPAAARTPARPDVDIPQRKHEAQAAERAPAPLSRGLDDDALARPRGGLP